MLRWARLQWDRVAAWCAITLGALFLILGWNKVAEEALTARQIPYIISGGMGGLFLLGLGGILWLSADLRDEWRKLDGIERQQQETHASMVAAIEDPFDVVPDSPSEPSAVAEPASPSGAKSGRPKRTRPLR